MDFSYRRKTGCLRKFCAYCCTTKRDLLKNNNFEKTIEIIPRVIICKKLDKCGTYHQLITVRNTGTLSRRLKFITEPLSDISYKINGNSELTCGSDVSVSIYVEPTKKKFINRNRYFYVIAEHPDIVWEIPILVIGDSPEVFIPELICLPKVPANTMSTYQFVIYNPLDNEISFCLNTKYSDLTISPNSGNILAKDYCKILLSGKIPIQTMTTSILANLTNGKSNSLIVRMEPSDQLIHLSTSILTFEDTYMGLQTQKNIHICNKSMETVNFRWSCSADPQNAADSDADEELVISEFIRIRNKRGCIPPMNSVLSIVTFCPQHDFNYNEEDEPPFNVNVQIFLFCPMLGSQSYKLQINGNILGPDIEINPKDIELGDIYMGQMQCLNFDVANKGPIAGTIYPKEHTDQNEIRCSLEPLSIALEPNSGGSFQFSFYRRDIGKFLTKLTFKSKFGTSLSVFLRGTSLAAKVKIWPEVFEFGNIPICIPQKRYALIANPLPVAIVIEPMVVDDGVEDPMILSVDNAKLPLHTRPATFYNMKCCKSRFGAGDEDELKPSYSDFGSNKSGSDATSTNSQLSMMFQNKVLDDIPVMAEELLKNVKTLQPEYQPEPGMQIIDAALDCILDRFDYFEDLKDKQNYLNMDWGALPCDAKEVAIEAERFYLKPSESKSYPVVLVPNSAGPCTKIIQFKACPMGIEHSELKTAIRSKYMVNQLQLQYKCAIPALECNDSIQFLTPLYVDTENGFNMKFRNVDAVSGFVYFKVIPKSAKGVMKVLDSHRKFFIAPNDEIDVSCSVIFRQAGTITLRGMFQLIGKLMEYPFKVEAEVMPPKMHITPERLTNKQQVLEFTRTRVFLENICPTVAQFSLSLQNDKNQFLEPLGGSLAPRQKLLISVFSQYQDPGVYKNVIYVSLKHFGKISIPLKFLVEGVPLHFEPNIKLGLDFGDIFKTDASQNHMIRITNFGDKPYRLLFLKQRPKTIALLPVSVFNIQPNGVTLAPRAGASISISLDTSKEVAVEEDFSVDVMGEDNCRLKFCTFTTKCSIIRSKVEWNRNGISLETGNPNESSNKTCDTAVLTNTTPLRANVVLNVVGCFAICDTMAGPMGKSIHFCLEGKALKELTISLNEDEIEANDMCQCLKGFIKCKVNNKAQKSFPLHAKIVNPGLRICTPQVTVLAQNIASYSHIYIHNCGPLKARFAWKSKTTVHAQSGSQKSKQLNYSKTVSETILSLAERVVLRISEIQRPEESKIYPTDKEYLDGDLSSVSEGASIKRESTTGNKGNMINLSLSSRRSSQSITARSRECKSLAFLSPKDEEQPFDMNEIFDFLKLPRLVCAEFTETTKARELDRGDRNDDEKGMRELEKNDSVVFQQSSGFIFPKTMFKAYMFLPPVSEGNILTAKFDLEVIGGRTESLEVTVAGLKGRIHVSKTAIELGRQIWFKTIAETIKVTNTCQYALKISLIENTNNEYHLTNGHVEIISPRVFIMMPAASVSIEWKALLGLRYHFIEDIGVEINTNVTAIPIRFHGNGLMPMITPLKLSKITPNALDNVTSFLAIHSIYADFQADKESQSQIDSGSIEDDLTVDGSKLSSSLSLSGEEIKSNFYRKKRSGRSKLNEFVTLVYSNETGPKGMTIEQLIETRKFIDELNQSKELKMKFDEFYSHCLSVSALEFDPVINLKFTICRPIPWGLPAYALSIGEMDVDEIKSFEIDLIFLGPGKMFASARTQTVIPGLVAWFEGYQRTGHPNSCVSFVQSPNDKSLTTYKNMRERDHYVPQEEEVGIPHAHSYDFDDRGKHQRKTSLENKKKIKEHYTILSQPFKEKKNPLILAELCQVIEEDLDDSTFKLCFRLAALNQFYENDQLIEDYLLIDTHLGPTLPILLQGRVAKSATTQM